MKIKALWSLRFPNNQKKEQCFRGLTIEYRRPPRLKVIHTKSFYFLLLCFFIIIYYFCFFIVIVYHIVNIQHANQTIENRLLGGFFNCSQRAQLSHKCSTLCHSKSIDVYGIIIICQPLFTPLEDVLTKIFTLCGSGCRQQNRKSSLTGTYCQLYLGSPALIIIVCDYKQQKQQQGPPQEVFQAFS